MLSPSSPTQKSLSEEDSSGSDAESEVSVEPETDRFGFILTNGSAAGTLGPSPELVRQREAKWINIIQQWDRVLLKKSSKVKVQCQKGIPASLRAKCWPLLCGATDRMKQNENLYQTLDLQPALQTWVDVIERDLDRQFPFHEMFLSKDGHGQRGLFRVLKAYTQYQPEEGYCQAQGPVAAVLLMNMPAEEAFWCLVQISEQYLPGYYSPLLEGVLFDAAMLSWVLKRTCPAAHKHLQHHGVEPLMFATDWLMCLFTRHLPFNTLLRVWDLFFCYGVRVLLQVAVVLVRRVLGRAEQRKQCQGQMETLEKLRGVKEQVQEEDDSFIAEVCSVPLSARDLEKRTTKQLEKWRKEKPSSTFDPKGRCHGFQMAWARAQQKKEERDKREREKGNLSVPIARSASTLSLSPSLLHKRFRRGGKADTEREGGGKVVRHLSMGGKDDWRSWTEINFDKVQDVQEEEDVVSEERIKLRETNITGQRGENEPLEATISMDKIQNIPTVHIEETVTANEQFEKVDAGEKEENELLSEQTEELNKSPAKDQTVENILQPNEHTSQQQHGEEPGSCSQSEIEEQQNYQGQDEEMEVKDINEEIEKQVVEENEDTTGVQEKQVVEENEDTTAVQEKQVVEENEDTTAVLENIVEENGDTTAVQEKQAVEENEDTTAVQENQVVEENGDKTAVQENQVVEENGDKTAVQENQVVEENGDKTAVQENQSEIQKDGTKDTDTETSKLNLQVSRDPSEQQMIQTDMKSQEGTETTDVQQRQVDTEFSETRTETSSDSETENNNTTNTKATPEKDPATETQQQQKEVIAETDTSSLDVFEVKDHSPESLVEIKIDETHAQKETESDVLTQNQEKAEENATTQDELEAEPVQTDSEQHKDSKSDTETEPIIQSSSECIQQDLVTDTETEAETPAHGNESSDTFAQCSETECDSVEHELTQEQEETTLTIHSEEKVDSDHTQAEETPTETQTKVEDADCVAPPQKEETLNLTAESEQMISSLETTSEEPEQPTSQIATENTEEENTVVEDNVFVSDDPHSDSIPQVQDKDSSQTEPDNSGLAQTSGHRSSRSSGDFCVRKSSTSHGSRLARRLSEDLFTSPQKTSQSQSSPDDPEVTESKCNPGAENQTLPEVTQSSEVKPSPTTLSMSEETVAQKEPQATPKRFGLFRRLRGEQPKKAKEKEKMQVPKILIQDFSDGTGKQVEEEEEAKLTSRERRRRRRERERKEKEEERLRKKKEKELEKEKERERRKPQTRGKSFQVQKDKGGDDVVHLANTGSQTLRHSVSYAESYF